MKTDSLKKGDFIVIKFEKKLAHAKVINPPNKLNRMNVFTQGTLKWIDAADFVRMGEKGADLKKGTFITNKENLKRVKESASDIQNEIKSLGNPSKPILEPVIEAGSEPEFPLSIPTREPIALVETDEMYLAPFRKGKSGKTLTVEQVSDAVGKSTPATRHAVERLASLGYLDLVNAELNEYALSIKGLKHVPGTAKPKSEIKKLKTDKKSGEVATSKKDRVLALLKNPDLSVKQIAEMTGAAQSYIRGIRERTAKKMDVPEDGTIKRKVFDALRAGGTLVDVAKRCKVTISYAYQIRQQMLSAKII